VNFNGPSLDFLGSGNLRTRSSKSGTPKSRYFTAVGQASVKTVADRHGHAAYHNKHYCASDEFF